jgi:cytochrome d ubiquinol oxidase subunit II
VHSRFAVAFHLLIGATGIVVTWALYRGRLQLARPLAMALVAGVVLGWAASQYPYLVFPTVTVYNARAPDATLEPLIIALGLGAAVLFPSLLLLYRVFKRR